MQNGDSKMTLFDPDGHLTEEGIAVCVDALRAKGYDALPDTILTHVDGCDRCKRSIVDTAGLLEVDAYERPKPALPLNVADRTRMSSFSYAYRIAASIVVCASIGILVYLAQILRNDRPILSELKRSVNGPTEQVRTESSAGSAQSASPSEYAANFVGSPTLENLANAVTRSTSVAVRAPGNGVTLKGKIEFEWMAREPSKIAMEILSNTGKPVYRFAHCKSPFHFNGELKPGLYYWKLEDESDLLYVGKFFVK